LEAVVAIAGRTRAMATANETNGATAAAPASRAGDDLSPFKENSFQT